ncbi:unnamed protein product, partial [marine sediment metagenome]
MKIGVNIKTGTGVLYNGNFTKKELKAWGTRPATPEEKKEYHRQKLLFDAHKIKRIV